MSCPLRHVAWPPEAWGELLGPSEPCPSSVVRPALSTGAGARVLGARPAPPALPRIQQNAHLPPSTRLARGPFPGCMFQIHLTFIKGGNNASIGIVTGQSLPVWAESLRRAQRARGLVSRASPRRGRGRGADTHSPAVVRSRGAGPRRPVTARRARSLPGFPLLRPRSPVSASVTPCAWNLFPPLDPSSWGGLSCRPAPQGGSWAPLLPVLSPELCRSQPPCHFPPAHHRF